ncbi:MAG: helix-turn-helix domain-containing protein [Azoarcus sp.]|jgi:DNA-binding XRE family transcriptional regulator|nr:helix-turn-helix domain-containing protein [Azoarcus sp.]
MQSISGATAFAMFKELKEKYGVKQNSIAKIIGVSRQAVTDMKAERRRFSRAMAEKLLLAFAEEPWSDWLRARLEELFTVVPPRFALPSESTPQSIQKPLEIASGGVCERSTGLKKFPLLASPCRGDPANSPANSHKLVVVPEELSDQAAESANPYVLIVDCDSRDGRLRRGDRVLVLQDNERESEIMIIDHNGALRLARRGRRARIAGVREMTTRDEMDWHFVDTGAAVPAEEAKPAGCVVGIVMAFL